MKWNNAGSIIVIKAQDLHIQYTQQRFHPGTFWSQTQFIEVCVGASSAGEGDCVVEAMNSAARAVHKVLKWPVVVDSKGVDHALWRILTAQMQNIEIREAIH